LISTIQDIKVDFLHCLMCIVFVSILLSCHSRFLLRHRNFGLVLPKSGSEPKFEPELSWTGPEVRSKVRHIPWTELIDKFRFGHKVYQRERVRTGSDRSEAFNASTWHQPASMTASDSRLVSAGITHLSAAHYRHSLLLPLVCRTRCLCSLLFALGSQYHLFAAGAEIR
jgi:hypothetical protein